MLRCGNQLQPASSRFILKMSMYGQPGVAFDPQPVALAAALVSVTAGPCPSSKIVPSLLLLDVAQRVLAHLVVGDRHADERVGIQHELDVLGQDRAMKSVCRSARRFWSW